MARANGESIRSNDVPLRQWMLRITSYADRLESELDDLNWPESIKLLQRNWIGRSVGAEVDFFIGDAIVRLMENRSHQKTGGPRNPASDVSTSLHNSTGHTPRSDLHGDCPGTSDGGSPDNVMRKKSAVEELLPHRVTQK